MVSPIDISHLAEINRFEAELLVVEKINELAREQQRLEQILDFLSQVVNSHEGNNNLTDDDDIQ